MIARNAPQITLFGLISQHPDRSKGGTLINIIRLANGFVRRGHQVDMLMRDPGDMSYLPERFEPAVRLVFIRSRHKRLIRVELLYYLWRRQPDLLLSFDTRANLIASQAMRLAPRQTRLWHNWHNALSPQIHDWPSHKLDKRRLQLREASRWAEQEITVSRGLAEDLVTLAEIDANKVRTVATPVLSDRIMQMAAAPIEAKWFRDITGPFIVSVGRLSQQKNYPLLLEAFADLQSHYPCHLLILGQGEDRDSLESLVERLNLRDRVHMPGFNSNPYALIARSRMLVLSSNFEGLPTVLIEALALGVPCVSTDCPFGPREILRDGELGTLVPMNDRQALCNAMLASASREHDRERLMQAGQSYRSETVVDDYLAPLLPPPR